MTAYIPQREPIVVVHGLKSHSEKESESVFVVEDGHLFVAEGKLLISGLMENIAQTAALRSGYQFSKLMQATGELKAPPIGFIAALKDFCIHQLPSVGDELRTTVTLTHEVLGMQVVIGTVRVLGKTVASCEMKIFLSQDDQGQNAQDVPPFKGGAEEQGGGLN